MRSRRCARGCDVASVAEGALRGAADVAVLRLAHAQGRVVLTHDADFGALANRLGEPVIGIVCLRPGHNRASFVLQTIDAVAALEAEAPFIVVAELGEREARVRVRRWG